MNPQSYYPGYEFAANAPAGVRVSFIRRTYAHLAGAILVFVMLESALFQTTFPESVVRLLSVSPYSWLIVLGAFMGVSYIAERWAQSAVSINVQYLGLTLYVLGQAIIFVPLLYMASVVAGSEVILSAGVLTLLLFTGLTFTAITTRRDFTFLSMFLKVSFFVALGIIVASILFGFNLGLLFSTFMVIVAAASILYNTSNVLHHYHPGQHVAAALTLFASIALLFWYILRIFMGFSRRD